MHQVAIGLTTIALGTMIAGCPNGRQSEKNIIPSQKNEEEIMAKTSERTLTDANFVAETSQGLVLVDFWAPWCGPCMAQGPIVEKVAEAMAEKATVGKCNVDEAPEMAREFGIRSIPTLLVMKDGKVVEQFIGVQSEAALISTLKKHAK